jgi:hypothetical protein
MFLRQEVYGFQTLSSLFQRGARVLQTGRPSFSDKESEYLDRILFFSEGESMYFRQGVHYFQTGSLCNLGRESITSEG